MRNPSTEWHMRRPEVHHIIGENANSPIHVPMFLQNYAGDPAIQVLTNQASCESRITDTWQDFLPKLRLAGPSDSCSISLLVHVIAQANCFVAPLSVCLLVSLFQYV